MTKKKKSVSVSKSKKQTPPAVNEVKFPATLLKPVGVFLKKRLRDLESRKKTLAQEDPFMNKSRTSDNASPDADAEEQFGHARTSAIREQLDRKIVQTKKALTMIKLGTYGICEDCGKMIDTDRLMVYPEATICAKCQAKREK